VWVCKTDTAFAFSHRIPNLWEKVQKQWLCCVLLTVNTHTAINNYRKRKNPTIKSKYTAIPNIVNIAPQIICKLFIKETREKTKAVSVLQTHTKIQIYEKTQRLCLSWSVRQTQPLCFLLFFFFINSLHIILLYWLYLV
jgi:hypothetical protein